jgi:putative addiction module killer protein
MAVYAVREFVRAGAPPFGDWFDDLDAVAAAKITAALYRLEQGNFSNVASVGGGVYEYKIDFGPGYRIYFGQEGNALFILLCGGTKKTQRKDIERARRFWREYNAGKE